METWTFKLDIQCTNLKRPYFLPRAGSSDQVMIQTSGCLIYNGQGLLKSSEALGCILFRTETKV